MTRQDLRNRRPVFSCASQAPSLQRKPFDGLSFIVWTVGITSMVAIALHFIGA